MPIPHESWAVLADEQRAKLLHCGPSEGGSPHIEHVDAISSSWEGHERGRPSPLKGRNSHTHAAVGHEPEEDRRRFALELVDWLTRQMRQREISRLTLFGPSRFVSTLRDVCPGDLAQRMKTEPIALINLPNAELHQHPAIRALIGLGSTSARS